MQRICLFFLLIGALISTAALADEAPPSTDEARRAKVVAAVGTETMTVGELEDGINSRSPYARKRFTNPDVLEQFVDERVKNALFYQGAEKLGYADEPVVREYFDQTLVQLFLQKEFEEAVTPESVPREDVTKYYEAHPEEFRRAEMRRARHILVGSKDEAEEVRQRAESPAAGTFRSLAKTLSLDTETNMRGGDLLYFAKDGTLVGKPDSGKVNETLASAAFGLRKTGDLSEPLDLGDGKWSVLELTGIRPEKVQTLEQADPVIRRKLWREEREGAIQQLIDDLRAELKPEIFPERMNAIVLTPYDQPIEPPNQ